MKSGLFRGKNYRSRVNRARGNKSRGCRFAQRLVRISSPIAQRCSGEFRNQALTLIAARRFGEGNRRKYQKGDSDRYGRANME